MILFKQNEGDVLWCLPKKSDNIDGFCHRIDGGGYLYEDGYVLRIEHYIDDYFTDNYRVSFLNKKEKFSNDII
jgi:hypothetical protein